MARIPTSPAVVFIENDNSSYPPNVDSSIVGLVGFASKGPVDEGTLITSQEQLVNTFGKPSEALRGQALEGAIEILETTNQVRFVRACPSDATNASATLNFGVCPAIQINASSWGVASTLYLTVQVKDSFGVAVYDNPKTFTITSGTASYQASALATIMGDGSSKDDAFGVYWTNSTSSQGYLVGSHAGASAALLVSAYSGAPSSTTRVSSLLAVSSDGNAYNASTVSSFLTVQGYDISANSMKYVVQSLYQGAGYNLGTASNGSTSGCSVEVDSLAGGLATLTVNADGISVENFNVNLQSGDNFIETAINTGTTNPTSDFIKGEIYVSGSATAITPAALTAFTDNITSLGVASVHITAPAQVLNQNPKFVKLVDSAATSLTGGSNGTLTGSTGNTALIGSESAKTGVYALDNDTYNISMAAIPGITEGSVQNALITLAETSQNFIAVVAPPVGLDTVEEAIDWMNGRSSTRTAAINTSWAAVLWPWVQVFSVFDQKDRWYDPAIFLIRQMCFTDNVSDPWFAPAGFRRGRLTKPTATEVLLNQGDRDALYGANVNPVVNFNPEGVTIFGQKTAQRASTALDRINVRRMMIYLRKVLLASGRIEIMEPDDAFTWERVKDSAEGVLSDIQARRGITDFRVICDETVNTPVRVDRNELWCKILIKPTKTAEWIVFEVNLTSQSGKFSG